MKALLFLILFVPVMTRADSVNLNEFLGPLKRNDLTNGEVNRLYGEAKKLCGGGPVTFTTGVMSCEDGRKIDVFNGAKIIDFKKTFLPEKKIQVPEAGPVVVKNKTDSKLEMTGCDDALAKEIEKLLSSDRSSLLELQFQLTALKMATRVVQEKNKKIRSVEDIARGLAKKINEQDKDKVRQKMVELYRREGLKDDSTFIEENLELFKRANAWKKQDRLYNENMSALITLDMTVNDKSNFNETDAAITWLAGTTQKKIIKTYGLGSAQANLSNLSYWVQFYSGAGNGGLVDESLILAKTQKVEETLQGAFKHAAFSIKEQIKECFINDRFKGEGPCWTKGRQGIDSEITKFIFKLSSDIRSSETYAEDIKQNIKTKLNKGPVFTYLFRP